MNKALAAALVAALFALYALPARAQTGVDPFFSFQTLNPDTSPRANLVLGTRRIWGEKFNGGANPTWWASVEPARGTFVWTYFDLVVNQALSRGIRSFDVPVMGYTPCWANPSVNGGSSTASVCAPLPPDNLQDAYNYATALVNHVFADCQAVGAVCTLTLPVCNECNTANSWNIGTIGSPAAATTIDSKMTTAIPGIAAAARAAAAAFPGFTVRILSPSTTNQSYASYIDSLLANPTLVAALDGIAIHPYATSGFFGYQPEQLAWYDQEIRTLQASHSTNLPVYWDEAGYSPAVTDAPTQTAWASLYNIIAKCDGVKLANWYAFDAPLGGSDFGRLWNGSSGPQNLNVPGVGYRQAEGWMSGATCAGPVTRTAAANGVRNPTFAGVVPPSTPPTNMSLSVGDAGLTIQFTGPTTVNGLPAIGLQVSGTPATTNYSYLYFDTTTGIPAVNGALENIGLCAQLSAGALNGSLIYLQSNLQSSGGGYLAGTNQVPIYPGAGPLSGQCHQFGQVLATASTAFIRPDIGIKTFAGVPVNFTLVIASPDIDTGSIYTAMLSKAGNESAMVAWAAGGTTPTLTMPGFTAAIRDTTGARITPSTSGQIALSNLPVMMETGVGGR